jgi:DNA polymerase III subunit epsilon
MAVFEHHSVAADGYRGTAPPAPSLPWREAPFAVLGLETTGPYPHRDEIISLACVPVEKGRAIIGKASETIVRPGRMDQVVDAIFEALTGRVLVAHAVPVHVGFLSAALRGVGIDLKGPALDTSALAAWVPPRGAQEADRPPEAVGTSAGLSRAASSMGLPVHRPHEAGGEALTTAQLFMALASKLDRVQSQSVGSLARLCSKNGDCNAGASR